ncbi:MAG: hemolysin III family protein [Chloroflexi bacterium]|nr:MAG: hemolysin III family protein [Chloroflexota bacterium]
MTERKEEKSPSFYTWHEELMNFATHGVATGLSIVGTAVLLVLAFLYGTVWHIIGFSVYGISLISLYLASTLYHGSRQPRMKRILRVLDHAAVYLLIAGTYTPFVLISVRTWLGWLLLGVVWGLAILGVVYKIVMIHKFERLSTAVYVLMGWMGVVAFREALAALPTYVLVWIAAGGVFYTIGVIFYAWRRLPYNHAIWHLFVVAGSVCHYVAVLGYMWQLV